MKDSIQLTLFFNEGTMYNPAVLSSKIIKKYPEIANPIILPINTEAPKEANVPFIVFNQNLNFQLLSNFNNLTITLKDSFIEKNVEIICGVYDILSGESIKMNRIGYVPTILLDKDRDKEFRSKYMISDDLTDVVDYQFSWLKNLKMGDLVFNCWERTITDSANIKGLLKIYDFNTKPKDKVDINKKFIKDFINYCNKYIDK